MTSNMSRKHDNLDLIRALLIVDDQLCSCGKRIKCDIVDNASFGNAHLGIDMIKDVYEKYPILSIMDEKYLKNGNYSIGFSTVSRHRLLENLMNYKGKGNALEESLRYGSNVSNIDEVINTLSTIEMGDESVNLSEGIQHNR